MKKAKISITERWFILLEQWPALLISIILILCIPIILAVDLSPEQNGVWVKENSTIFSTTKGSSLYYAVAGKPEVNP